MHRLPLAAQVLCVPGWLADFWRMFGSYADDSYTIRSDIDICLVAGKRNVKEIFNMFLAEDVTEKYEIKIFEMLPLYMKAEVLENAVVVWANDEPGMSYYFYRWRRLIKDQLLIRQKMTA